MTDARVATREDAMAVDPVCGMYVDESTSQLTATVGGRRYYFCSTTCRQTFLEPERELRKLRTLVVLSFALAIPAFLLSLATELRWTPDAWMLPLTVAVFLLATPVQFGPGLRFYRGTLDAVRNRSANMDVLISMVTGESMPIDKDAGARVIGATVNRSGLLRIRATRVGKDTTLSQIIQLVEDAQRARAPIQRFADRVAAVFVPAVITAAVVAAAYWYFLGFAAWRSLLAAYGLHAPLTSALFVFVPVIIIP